MGNANKYRNLVDDPYLAAMDQRKSQHDFCGCGMYADGDEGGAPADENADVNDVDKLKGTALNMRAWKYIKNGLMIIGLIVAAKFIYNKLK